MIALMRYGLRVCAWRSPRRWAMEASGSVSIRSRAYCMTWAVPDLIVKSLAGFGPGRRSVGFRQDHANGERYTQRRPMGEKRRPFSGVIDMILRPMGLR